MIKTQLHTCNVKSMKFCTMILLTKTIILRSGPILKVTYGDLGSHFEFCPLWDVFLSIAVTVLPSITRISLVYVYQTMSIYYLTNVVGLQSTKRYPQTARLYVVYVTFATTTTSVSALGSTHQHFPVSFLTAICAKEQSLLWQSVS